MDIKTERFLRRHKALFAVLVMIAAPSFVLLVLPIPWLAIPIFLVGWVLTVGWTLESWFSKKITGGKD
jgi:hypothetical protein